MGALAACTGGGSGGALEDGGVPRTSSSSSSSSGDRWDPPPDPPADAGKPLSCRAQGIHVLDLATRDDAGTLPRWTGKTWLVRAGEHRAHVLARRSDRGIEVLAFDPAVDAPATVIPLPIDAVLDARHEDGALRVYGISGGADAALVLVAVDDAAGAVTSQRLTAPGAVTERKSSYAPQQGSFARFGAGGGDVYFSYTEEVGIINNPTYRWSVGRFVAGGAPVTMAVAGTAGPHAFQPISAYGIVHAGTKAYVLTGASGVSNDSDRPQNAMMVALPDDGTVPAALTKRFLSGVLLGAVRDASTGTTRFAFAEPGSSVFDDPRAMFLASVPDRELETFEATRLEAKVSNDAPLALTADAHLEGDQLLWFGSSVGVWVDTTTGKQRVSFRAPNPLDGSTTTIGGGAAAFGSPVTEAGAEIDVAFWQHDGTGHNAMFFSALRCESSDPPR